MCVFPAWRDAAAGVRLCPATRSDASGVCTRLGDGAGSGSAPRLAPRSSGAGERAANASRGVDGWAATAGRRSCVGDAASAAGEVPGRAKCRVRAPENEKRSRHRLGRSSELAGSARRCSVRLWALAGVVKAPALRRVAGVLARGERTGDDGGLDTMPSASSGRALGDVGEEHDAAGEAHAGSGDVVGVCWRGASKSESVALSVDESPCVSGVRCVKKRLARGAAAGVAAGAGAS